MPSCHGVDIEELSIQQLGQHLQAGTFTSRELTECYLKRIHQLNPYTRTVIEMNPDALEIADAMDEEREQGKVRGAIHGIPFLVKDNMATKDKMQTTAGSSVLIGTTVSEDAHIVMLLRAAGAVLLGHANLSEWASMRASYYSEGYSSRGGQCRNPYNLAHHPGGSSCGSAGAVATNMCAFSLGTETDGSVIFPADRNGIVGIKATVGSISCDGIIPESSSLDAVGTFGRRVVDAAIALDVIYGNGQFAVFINLMLIEIVTQDEKVSHRERPSSKSIISAVSSREALNGATFGLPWKRVWETASKSHKHKLEYDILKMVVTRIREAGAEVIESVDFPSADEIIPPAGWDWDFETRKGHPEHSEFTVVKTEFYNGLKTYLAGLSTNPHHITSLEDIMRYNVDHTTHEGGIPGTHPAWPTGQDNFEKSMKSRGVEDETYRKALEYIRRKAREEGIDTAMSSEGRELDGLLVPIQAEDGVAVQVAAKAGYPMITIPVGVNHNGVPFGLGIMQSAWKERELVKYSSAIEDLISGRKKPNFLNPDAKNYMYVGVR